MKEQISSQAAPTGAFERSLSRPQTKYSFFQQPSEYEIPTLLLLDDMVALINFYGGLPNLSNTVVIGVQHMLETTVTLFDAFIALGIQPANMFFSGKCYSSCPLIEAQVIKRGIHLMPSNKPKRPGQYAEYCQEGIASMWEYCLSHIREKKIDRIIILDEGGRCLENMPEFVGLRYRVAAIEQTRGGLYTESVNLLPFPLIEVATCAVKKILEPPLIAKAVLISTIKKIEKLLFEFANQKDQIIFGVIGNGAIGNAICSYLLQRGHDVVIYDENENAFPNLVDRLLVRVGSVEEVIANANIIFGCTGKDVTQGIDILSIAKKDKTFISCTSEDKEFRSLLLSISQQSIVHVDTLADLTCLTKNGRKITILQGGFPINFDRLPWNVPAKDIEITQGLLLGGFLQAIYCATKPISDGQTINRGSRQALDSFIQRYVALHWLERQNTHTDAQLIEKFKNLFDDIKFIQNNSGGTYYNNSLLTEYFSSKPLNIVSQAKL